MTDTEDPKGIVDKAIADAPEELTEQTVIDLAGLTPLEYAKQINRTAKKCRVPVKHLEKLVDTAKVQKEAESLLEEHWKIEPADEPVSAILLLEDIVARIQRHVIISDNSARVCALWVMLTWIHDKATYSPILLVTSAEANSGKTTLMGVLTYMVRRALVSVGATGAVLYRSIEKWAPTFVIDEADEAFIDNPDLRQVVNSGWTRGQSVIRCDPNTNEPRKYSTFCPKAIGLKGKKLPDTTMSRTIVIEMKRKLAAEPVEHFAHIDDHEFRGIRSRLARWSQDNGGAIAAARAVPPEGFIDRLASNWELLCAIADSISPETGERARTAALAVTTGANVTPSRGVELLRDIKAMFDRSTLDHLTSKFILPELETDKEKPWAEWSHGRPITEKGVAALLKEFKIKSKDVGHENNRVKGYKKADFEDPWKRYLDPEKESPPQNGENLPRSRASSGKSITYGENPSAQPDIPAREKNSANPLISKELRGCARKNGGITPSAEISPPVNGSAGCTTDPWAALALPDFLNQNLPPEKRVLNRPAISAGPDDSLDDFTR